MKSSRYISRLLENFLYKHKDVVLKWLLGVLGKRECSKCHQIITFPYSIDKYAAKDIAVWSPMETYPSFREILTHNGTFRKGKYLELGYDFAETVFRARGYGCSVEYDFMVIDLRTDESGNRSHWERYFLPSGRECDEAGNALDVVRI